MSLARLLADQRRRLVALAELLEQERSLLTVGHIDGKALQAVAERKRALLAELERTEQLRRRVQARLGYADGPQGARDAAADADCLADWEACLAQTERTARLNELVGELIALRSRHNQQMLELIQRVAEKTLYDPRGRTGRQPGRLNTSV